MTLKVTKKNAITVVLAAVLVIAVTIGTTLAWMTAPTNTKDNSFNVKGDVMKATLTEPSWDSTGQAMAQQAVPGQNIPKDPTVNNTTAETDNISEWVGLKVTFADGSDAPLSDADYTQLMSIITIMNGQNSDSTDGAAAGFDPSWYMVPGTTGSLSTMYFYYKTILPVGDSTAPLFTYVDVNSSATNAQMDFIKTTLGGFNILIAGAAVQSDIAASPAWTTASNTDQDNVIAAINALY